MEEKINPQLGILSGAQGNAPSNINLLSNIVQAFNTLNKLGTTNVGDSDKSKDPRMRKKK
jgi:hypothetical protein